MGVRINTSSFRLNSAVAGGAVYWTSCEPAGLRVVDDGGARGGEGVLAAARRGLLGKRGSATRTQGGCKLVLNAASGYGPDLATPARGLEGGEALECTSGQAVDPPPSVAVVDSYSQTVTTEDGESYAAAAAALDDGTTLSGGSVLISAGVAAFDNLVVTRRPNSTTRLELTADVEFETDETPRFAADGPSSALSVTMTILPCAGYEYELILSDDDAAAAAGGGNYTAQCKFSRS